MLYEDGIISSRVTLMQKDMLIPLLVEMLGRYSYYRKCYCDHVSIFIPCSTLAPFTAEGWTV